MTSAETAARFRARYEKRLAHMPKLIANTTIEAAGFREYVLGLLSERLVRPTRVVHRMAIDDWGAVSRRTIERALSRLVKDGSAVRTAAGYTRRRM